MLDIQFIRDNKEIVEKAITDKNVDLDLKKLLSVDDKRRELQTQVDDINRQRNELTAANKGAKPSDKDVAKGKELKEQVATLEDELRTVEQEYIDLMYQVPNIPSDDTPVGPSEDDSKILETVGEKPNFDFEPKEHWQLGQDLDLIDTETGAEIAGARFAYMKGDLVLLQFALVHYGMSVLTNEDMIKQIASDAGLDVPTTAFIPVRPPVMLKTDVYRKTARLMPGEQTYQLAGDDNLWLIGSAEHTMVTMHMKETLQAKDLPRRYVGFSTAFRREAGTYGKDMKGIFRNHQFDKLEMESFTTPDKGRDEHELMIAIQEHLTATLNLPYQVVLKSTGDMGTPNARGVDIETWLPGQGAYRETHTADYIADYQTRRLGTKVQVGSDKPYAYANDATAYAGRTLIAIMENFQTAQGTIRIPEVLHPWMHGITEIKKK